MRNFGEKSALAPHSKFRGTCPPVIYIHDGDDDDDDNRNVVYGAVFMTIATAIFTWLI